MSSAETSPPPSARGVTFNEVANPTRRWTMQLDAMLSLPKALPHDEQIAYLNTRVTRSEERWRTVFENSAIGVALTDLNGRFLAVNRAYEEMLGYSKEELHSLSFLQVTHEDYREVNRALITELLAGRREQFQIEKQYRRKDGSLIWVSNNVSVVPGSERIPRFIMALSENIEERKRAQEALQRSEERARTLLEINNAIISDLTQEALLHSVTEALRRVIPFDRCAFTLYQPETDTFRYLAIKTSINSDYFRPGMEFDRKQSVSAWVFDHRLAMLRGDIEKEQRYPNDRRLVADGIRSSCVVPMNARGKCVGTLNVSSKTRNRYAGQDAEFLQEVANQVGLAMENVKAYEEISALRARLEAENVYLQEEILREHNFNEIVGNSPALLEVLRRVEMAAPTDATVLLYGETGTGKELIARAIHSRSVRSARPMVTVNCGAIPSGLVESELFGHVKGAFTGALHSAAGRFELANGSTLFLDEVAELPLETQVKLLRVLQEREFQPVGSNQTKLADVRIIAATNRNLQEDVETGRFRSDLFYRLNVLPLRVPPLRERRSDIRQLILFFLHRSCQKFGKKIDSVSQETLDHLTTYDWPGNIRELQNVVERGVVLSCGPILTLGHDLLPVTKRKIMSAPMEPAGSAVKSPHTEAPESFPNHTLRPPRALQDVERDHIAAVLEHTGGKIEGSKGAAKILELHPSTLRARMKKLCIHRSTHRI